MFRMKTLACINLIVTNIVNHENTCSFFQKPENVHVVNYSAIAHLRGIKSTQ